MNIAMLTDTFLPINGGAENHVLALSCHLRKLGHSVRICTSVPGPNQVDGFRVVRIPELRAGRTKALPALPRAMPAIVNELRWADIVHAHYSHQLSAVATVMGRIGRKPIVVTLHGLGTLSSSVGRSVVKRSYRRISLRYSSAVIATSEEMKVIADRIRSTDDTRIIPNGVDVTYFLPHIDDGTNEPHDKRRIVLTMRRLVPKNGVQYLIEAAPEIVRRVPEVEFWIAGSGRLEPYLRSRVDTLGLSEYVRFFGDVPHDRTRDYYAHADAVVFPSSAESTSLACLEAMAMQKTIVSSNVGAFRKLMGKNERGLLVELFDEDMSNYDAPMTLPAKALTKLADAVCMALLNEELHRRLGANARKYVLLNHDWRVITQQVVSIYEGLLERESGPYS